MSPTSSAASLASPGHRERTGLLIAGTYRLLAELGSGSMGEVYEAEHVRLGKRVAVKLLRRDLLDRRRAVERFRREARAVAAIENEHVVSVFDCGELEDAVPYLVMERLLGEDLEDERVALAGVLAQAAGFPLAEVHLAQLALDDRLDAEPRRQRRRRLMGPLQRRDVDRVDALRRQPRADRLCLRKPVGVAQRRVAVAVDQLERVVLVERGRLAVADEQDRRGARGRGELDLTVLLSHRG